MLGIASTSEVSPVFPLNHESHVIIRSKYWSFVVICRGITKQAQIMLFMETSISSFFMFLMGLLRSICTAVHINQWNWRSNFKWHSYILLTTFLTDFSTSSFKSYSSCDFVINPFHNKYLF